MKNVKWKNETIGSAGVVCALCTDRVERRESNFGGKFGLKAYFWRRCGAVVGSARLGWWVVQDGRVCKYIETGDFQR